MLYRNLIYSILLLVFLEINLFAQFQIYNWESIKQTAIPESNFGWWAQNKFDMTADNFGMHFVGIYGLSHLYDWGTLKYFLVDNNGNILNQNLDLENGNKVTCCAVCSYHGTVYIAEGYVYAGSKKIKIWSKPNNYPFTNWSVLGEYDISTIPNIPFQINMTADEYGLHIVWGNSEGGPESYIIYVYYLNYKLAENRWANFGQIQVAGVNSPFGTRGRLTTSKINGVERVHIIFCQSTDGGWEYQDIVTKDYKFNSYDDIYLEYTSSTNNWGNYTFASWGNLVLDPRPGGKIYAIASPSSMSSTGSAAKQKDVITTPWGINPIVNQTWGIDLNLPQSAFYDFEQPDKIPVLYGYYRDGNKNVELRNLDIFQNPPQFEQNYQPIFSGNFNNNIFYTSNIMKVDSQGVYAVALAVKNGPHYIDMRRRPKEIRNDISYNSLWTGNTYLNAPNSPYIHSNGANIVALPNSITRIKAGTKLYIDNNYIHMQSNSNLVLEDNVTLNFSGSNAYFKLDLGATINSGQNVVIRFENGAYLDADGAGFGYIYPSVYWQGIVFENAGANTNIRNCMFSKAVVALNFNNTLISTLTNAVYNNTFNVPAATWAKGIYARNLYNATFSHNTFNLSTGTIGAIIQNSYNPPPEGDGSVSELRFINNNTFNGGYIQLFIGGYASNNIPVFVDGNSFNNGGWCFVGRMITGDVKNNTMTRNSSNHAAWLYQSNPDLTNNTIRNNSGNGLFLTASYPVLGPTIDGSNRFVWFGGVNNIISVNGDALNIYYSKPVLDNGANNLTISNSTYYHLYGLMDGTETIYNARNNCWYYNSSAGTPRIYVYNINNNVVSVNTSGTIVCNTQINYNSFIINDHGDGVLDTVWISDNTTGTQAPDDEVLYTQAELYKSANSYFEAITDFKNLINNYPASSYIYTSLYDLYACYEGLDTADQTHRDLIFSDLKFYLENKIVQYAENDEFVSIAYNLILMCETKIENYNEAMDGYEFISLYHPDPEQRLWASMDYGEIQTLLSGMGGGETGYERSRMSIEAKALKILKLMDKKPYTKIVKNIFTKASRELDKKLNDKDLREDKQTIQKKELIERAKQNINISRSLTKQQREERRMEDIKLLIKQTDDNTADNSAYVPSRYMLYQNFPNPFNPITTIKYELPNDALITFKIYDILGKEIYSLNEFRKAGIYSITFDGSKYASGIYFYRLESGHFSETKKMVLVK